MKLLLFVLLLTSLNLSYANSYTEGLRYDMFRNILDESIKNPELKEQKLRYENISDIEVRQIQSVIEGIQPGSIVNIGGVTEGCTCEEDRSCTNQVSIVSYLPSESTGLTLSKINGEWMIGVLQGWWLEYEALFRPNNTAGRATQYSSLDGSYESRVQTLHDNMPSCDKISEKK